MTALGAAARFSNRSSNLGGLVKNGCNKATVRVTLLNEGDDAYQPEIYGPSIIIERSIMKTGGGGGFTIKDHTGKKVSGSKADIVDITEQFNIQVDNPCTILMQDASKMFLNSNKPEKKYELFLKATQLEQMKVDLETIGDNLKSSETVLQMKQDSLKTMEDRIKSLEAKVEALNALQKFRTKLKELRGNLAWSHVQTQEEQLEAIEAELSKIEEQSARLVEAKVGREATLAKMHSDQQEKAAALEELRGDATDISRTSQTLIAEERNVKAEASGVEVKIEARKAEQTRIQGRRANIQSEIRKLQTAGQGEKKEAEYRKKLAQAEKKRETMTKLSDELKQAEATQATTAQEVETDDDLLGNVTLQLEAIKKDIAKLAAEEKRLRTASKDRNAAFGASAPAVVQLIQKHARDFQYAPVGPIGMHVTLLDDEWAYPVEGYLGKVFEKFIVHDAKDMRTLQTLIKRAKIFPAPALMVLPLNQPAYNIPGDKLPDPKFKTLLSTIRVDNAACFNALIDEASPEATVLFHTTDEAKSVLFGRQRPINVKDAYAADNKVKLQITFGTQVMFGLKATAPRLQADVSEQLAHTIDLLKQRQQHLPPIQQEHSAISQRLNRSRSQANTARNILRNAPADIERLAAKIEELEKAPEVEPSQAPKINALQATLPELDNKIDSEQVEIDLLQAEKREILKKLDPVVAKQKANNTRKEELERLLQEAARELDTLRTGIATTSAKMPQFDAAITKLGDQRTAANTRHTEQSTLVEEWIIKARMLKSRPEQHIEDSPDKLKRLIEKLEETIATQEKKEDLSAAVLEEYEQSKATLIALQNAIAETQETIDLAAQMLTVRAHKWVQFRRFISQRANALFISYLSYRNFDGQLIFDHKERTLNIHINPNRADATGSRDTTTLSGGERSYSTVSLLLALWDTMESPFRAMDEFDVFMDTANRKISMELLLEAASEKASRQHIFLTPQQLQSVKVGDNVRVFKMRPPVRNNRTITEMLGAVEEAD